MDPEQIVLSPPMQAFTAPLPDGTEFRDAIALTGGLYGADEETIRQAVADRMADRIAELDRLAQEEPEED